jgi:diguanylate cyclase (GGDEF)-like protein
MTIEGESFLTSTLADPSSDLAMHAMVSEDVAYAGIDQLARSIAVLSAAIVSVALLLGAVFSGRLIVNPIKAVTAAMTNISRGKVDVDLHGKDRRDEVGQMLRAIEIFRDNLRRDNLLLQKRDQELSTQNLRFDSALTNMSQGLSMFDSAGYLTVSNPQYAFLYQLSETLVQPGTSLKAILRQLVVQDALSEPQAERYNAEAESKARSGKAWDQTLELGSGRVITVSHRPMPSGGWVATHTDITEQREAEAQIAHMARHDALTNLPNRVLFRTEVEQAIDLLGSKATIAILCLDLDRFKAINDTLGHPVGDALLREVAGRLSSAVGEGCLVARLGGDEFAIVQTMQQQPEGATELARQIIDKLSEPYLIKDHHIVIGATVGIAFGPEDGANPDDLLKSADLALYRGKADGGGTYRLFEAEMDARMQARRETEVDLRAAIAREEFELYYQPLMDVESSEIIGFEALIRWHHPKRGLVTPAEFIPIAEETGLIVQIGEWVLRRACFDAAKWPANIRVSVNLSPVQFRSAALIFSVAGALASSRLSPTRLDLEITETVLLQDSETTIATLFQLREMGVQISMDDFGTGYSSLSYLQKFPFSKIKIDQSFIRDIGKGPEAIAIIRAVTGMSKGLGMATIAEGVETREQLDQLRAEGCTEIQGYYVSKPRPIAEATALLERRAPILAVG